MKKETDLEMDVQRGEQARQILKSPLVNEAISNMRAAVYHNIETSNHKDVDDRENLYKMLQCIRRFESEFERQIRGGEKAKATLMQKLRSIAG